MVTELNLAMRPMFPNVLDKLVEVIRVNQSGHNISVDGTTSQHPQWLRNITTIVYNDSITTDSTPETENIGLVCFSFYI